MILIKKKGEPPPVKPSKCMVTFDTKQTKITQTIDVTVVTRDDTDPPGAASYYRGTGKYPGIFQ